MSDEDFVELCISGGTVKVEEAIINGANVNAKDKDDTKRIESRKLWGSIFDDFANNIHALAN